MLGLQLRSNALPAAVLALLLSSTAMTATAIAADLNLGGACCADLEEKVQELEATLVKKGNRRMSLTLYGQVNKALLYWNDGARSNTYLGLDNSNSSTRLGFMGEARINTAWSAGFNMLIEVSGGARSMIVDQRSEDGPTAELIGGSQDHRLSMRDANWWLENKVLGRLTVGRLTGSGPQGTIDVGGTSVVAPGTVLGGGGLLYRNATTNALTAFTVANTFDGLDDRSKRQDGVRYTSPSLGGLTLTASVGEALKVQRITGDGTTNIGRVYGFDLRYAAEFQGVRFAAAYGYERGRAEEVFSPFATSVVVSDARNRGLSLSLVHLTTGLFLQGHRTTFQRDFFDANTGLQFVLPASGTARVTALQGGVAKNWFGIGNTVVYAEYAKSENGASAFAFDLTGIDAKFRGLGIIQNIDAAAMEVYAGYRKHGLDDAGTRTIDVITAGARIKF